MSFDSLVLIIGIGALFDAMADMDKKKSPVVALIGASVLVVILGTVGKLTKQWGLVSALAFLYVLWSVLTNKDALAGAYKGLTGKQEPVPGPMAGGGAGHDNMSLQSYIPNGPTVTLPPQPAHPFIQLEA